MFFTKRKEKKKETQAIVDISVKETQAIVGISMEGKAIRLPLPEKYHMPIDIKTMIEEAFE